jgi:hypothetical protein
MNSDRTAGSGGRARRAAGSRGAAPAEEELETGEPIPGEDERFPTAKPIAGVRGEFGDKPPGRPEPPPAPGGRLVLATAKYMPRNDESEARNRQKPCASGAENSGRSLEARVLNGGVWGGMLAMTVAVLWFGAGLMNDTIWFYPPVLFFLGLIGFLRAPAERK